MTPRPLPQQSEGAQVAARALDLMRADAFPFTEPVDQLAEVLHRGLFDHERLRAAIERALDLDPHEGSLVLIDALQATPEKETR